jgi:hypothetical protein
MLLPTLLLHSRARRVLPHLQKSRATALDCNSQQTIAKCRTVAISFEEIAHLEVILDIALQQVAAPCADPTHDAVLREDNCVSPHRCHACGDPKPAFTNAAQRSYSSSRSLRGCIPLEQCRGWEEPDRTPNTKVV